MTCRRKDSFLWGKAERPPLMVTRTGPVDPSQTVGQEQIPYVAPVSGGLREQKKNRSRLFLSGKKKFNMDPKKGICYLVENNFLEWSAGSVAEFMYKEEGLNKTAIGLFLGEREEMHVDTLKAFVNLHEFTDLNLVQALRQFLWSFRLPGEAQKIDRMMEAFAARYCHCNAGVFQSTDTCYILSFSIIMLNTSLHNPSVKDKPDLRRFFTMNHGIDHGQDLSADLLTKLYHSIYNEPFKIPEDDGNDLTLTFFNPDREGWLLKRGGRVKTWKRRWFILTDSCLYYFQYTTDKDPIGIIPLENISVRPIHDPSKRYCLELSSSTGQKVKACKVQNHGLVEGKHQAYRLSAASQQEQEGWISSIRSNISKDPFYDLVSSRRRKILSSSNNDDNNNNNNNNISYDQQDCAV